MTGLLRAARLDLASSRPATEAGSRTLPEAGSREPEAERCE
jgi:hypothetical protein